MAAKIYVVANGQMPTTAALVKQATGTALRTMLQIVPSQAIRVVEYGVSFDASAAAAPGAVELIDTYAIACSGLTAYSAADVQPVNDPNALPQTSTLAGTGSPATATSGTTLTATGTPWTVNQWIGAVCIAGGSFLFVTSNTTSVLTGSAGWVGGTPGATSAFTLQSGGPLLLGSALSGYYASGNTLTEGTPTQARYVCPPQLIAPTSQYLVQQPLGREGEIPFGHAARIRMTFAATVNAYCYIAFEV